MIPKVSNTNDIPRANSTSPDDECNTEETPLLRTFKDQQSTVLPPARLLIVFLALALAQFTAFLDQTSISTALPAIASGLHIGSSISWVGASFLCSSTSIHLVNGRLSDIFGRKACLILSLFIMGFGNLLSGFARTPIELYMWRALSGFGAGAIGSLVQISISDITTLEQRGHYFGIIGIFVALGNGLGPLIGGLLTQNFSWRWAFWFISPMTIAVIIILIIALPPSPVTGNMYAKIKLVDWLGVTINMAAVLLILIPISEGGSTFAWNSPILITMLSLGTVLWFAFVVVEWRFAKLPIVPLRLFKNGLSANILLMQNLLIGFVFWGNLFYIPIYFQNVRGWSPSRSGELILPMVIAHGIFSGISGSLVSHTGHYNPVIISGAAVWTVAASAKMFYTQATPDWAFIVVGAMEGFGIGFCFQPVLVALMANSLKADRAVMTGLRNFLRAMGGAIGLTVSAAVLNNVLYSELSGTIDSDILAQITSSVFALPNINLSEEQKTLILEVYMRGIHAVFTMYACLVGVCFVTSMFVVDRGLAEKEETNNESGGVTRNGYSSIEQSCEQDSGRRD